MNIQYQEVQQRRKQFEATKEICNHNYNLLKEYYHSTSTGDYICSNCYDVVNHKS